MKTLLIVEEDGNQRILYRMELEDEGYRVVTAGDPDEALRAVAQERPDLVVLDPHMRRRKADGVLPRIRASDPHLPVIVYTGGAGHPYAPPACAADAYLVKSSNLNALKRAVSGLLARRGRARRPSHLPAYAEVDVAPAF